MKTRYTLTGRDAALTGPERSRHNIILLPVTRVHPWLKLKMLWSCGNVATQTFTFRHYLVVSKCCGHRRLIYLTNVKDECLFVNFFGHNCEEPPRMKKTALRMDLTAFSKVAVWQLSMFHLLLHESTRPVTLPVPVTISLRGNKISQNSTPPSHCNLSTIRMTFLYESTGFRKL